MTQRLNKFLERNRVESPRRAVFTSEDPEKISADVQKIIKSTRAGPENSREFSSYFYGTKIGTPNYFASSHASCSKQFVKKPRKTGIKEQVVTVCPTLVPGLRWSPSIESITEDLQEDFVCRRCRNCNAVPEKRIFKDNIIRFSDSSTMTSNLHDAGCVTLPRVEACYSSNISVPSDIAVRDEPEQVRFSPHPILRDQDARDAYHYYQQRPVEIAELDQEDLDSRTYAERGRRPSWRSTLLNESDQMDSECIENRKNLYNEGISDNVANHRISPLTKRLAIPTKTKYSKTSFFSKNVAIPFAHQSRSKYHRECKTEGKKKPMCVQREARQTSKPRAVRPAQPYSPNRCDLMPSKRPPRKVLSSELDIDLYIQKQQKRPVFFT